mgnify:CR=1 FL=1
MLFDQRPLLYVPLGLACLHGALDGRDGAAPPAGALLRQQLLVQLARQPLICQLSFTPLVPWFQARDAVPRRRRAAPPLARLLHRCRRAPCKPALSVALRAPLVQTRCLLRCSAGRQLRGFRRGAGGRLRITSLVLRGRVDVHYLCGLFAGCCVLLPPAAAPLAGAPLLLPRRRRRRRGPPRHAAAVCCTAGLSNTFLAVALAAISMLVGSNCSVRGGRLALWSAS